jgi:hypothetical protein
MKMINRLSNRQIIFVLADYRDEITAKHNDARKARDTDKTEYYGGQLDAIEELAYRLLYGGEKYE